MYLSQKRVCEYNVLHVHVDKKTSGLKVSQIQYKQKHDVTKATDGITRCMILLPSVLT